jgi:hypothetical protein
VHTFVVPPDADFEVDALGPTEVANRFAVERKARAIAAESLNRAGMKRASATYEAVTLLKMWLGQLERECVSEVADSSSSSSASALTDETCIRVVHSIFDGAREAIMKTMTK